MTNYWCMREKIKDKGRLEHILDAINGIMADKDLYTLEQIKSSTILFYGFTKYVEIIGEAVYMLTKEFRISHPEVNWRQIECMRHVLVHGYYTIDPDSLWDTIQNDIPALKSWIEIYLKEMDKPK